MSIAAGFMLPHPPLIIPKIGRGEEKRIQSTVDAFHEAAQEIADLKPETIVVVSPHCVMYEDYIHISPGEKANGDFGQFGAGQVTIEAEYDTQFVEELCHTADKNQLMAGTLGEQGKDLDHGTMVPLYFINQVYQDYRLVRIGLSGLPLEEHYALGKCIRTVSDKLNRRTVFIASGDLSHRLKEYEPYGYQKEGPAYDERIMEVMGNGDFQKLFTFEKEFREKAAECGHLSFVVLAGAFDKTDVKAKRLSYEGPFGVGYGICTFYPVKQDVYVGLARESLETYVKKGKIMDIPEDLPAELTDRCAGTFVSLKKDGRLRGCIGTITATKDSIAEEIIHNAVSAGMYDPRFYPVAEEELKELIYSVDVLGNAEEISSKEDLDVKKYGVIVSKGQRKGLLLPNLEGIDTVEEQIAIAREKAGIGKEEHVKLQRFEVIRHR